MNGSENINPYAGDRRHKARQVEDMFDHIAPAYDRLNTLMSLGMHGRWRRRAVEAVAASAPATILDVATGTGDFAISLAQAVAAARVTGIDLSQGMIDVGRAKIDRAGLGDRIALRQADCLALPFDDGAFDAVTCAFGVRNFERLLDGYREIARVMRPGALLAVIELSRPTNGLVRPFYTLYSGYVIPGMGRLLSADAKAYRYLPQSISAVAQGDDMLALMRQAGLSDTRCRTLTMGVCSLYTARKPWQK